MSAISAGAQSDRPVRNTDRAITDACVRLFGGVTTEAARYIGGPDDGCTEMLKSAWTEHFSTKHRRYYYVNATTQRSTWDLPEPVQLRQWMMDEQLFRVDLPVAAAVFRTIYGLTVHHWQAPDRLWACIALLARLLGNVTSCDNTIEKYRHVRAANPKVRDAVLAMHGAEAVLLAAGFSPTSEGFDFPAAASPATMAAARLAASRLAQLVEHKGFTGDASPVDDHGDDDNPATANPARTRWHGQPGFRYQTLIYQCSLCGQPINDGSERLFTRAFDAPHGEFRYECEQCLPPGPAFNLCQRCFDGWSEPSGQGVHLVGHTFRAVHPRISRHGAHTQSSDANPWGVSRGDGRSVARARDRLKERTGL